MKPDYKIPSMDEIKKIDWNGFNVISTFSGCGGSSLGYKMAGFRVLWANEFIPAAQDTYTANHSGTILNKKDIRDVDYKDILFDINMVPGQLDLFDGSPPCSSFSTAGQREKKWGEIKKYSDSAQRTDDLFYEYIRILDGIKPKVFVAENVKGLVKGTAKGYFIDIIGRMKKCGYKVSARVLNAKWLGVPQSRERVIFIGVRDDLELSPKHPEPLKYFYSVKDAIPYTVKVRKTLGFSSKEVSYIFEDASICTLDTIGTETSFGNNKDSTAFMCLFEDGSTRKLTISELKKLGSFPDDFILTGTDAQKWERIGRAVPPIMMYHIAKTIRDEILCKLK